MTHEEALKLAIQINTNGSPRDVIDTAKLFLDFANGTIQIPEIVETPEQVEPDVMKSVLEVEPPVEHKVSFADTVRQVMGVIMIDQDGMSSTELRQGQKEVIDLLGSDRNGIVATHRQFGKTSLIALYAFHVLTQTKSRLVICSPRHNHSLLIKAKLEELLASIPVGIIMNGTAMMSEQGAMVTFSTPTSVVGDMTEESELIVDEAAYVSFSYENQLLEASKKSKRRTLYISTPNSNESAFTKIAKTHAPNNNTFIDVLVIPAESNQFKEIKAHITPQDYDTEYSLESFQYHIGVTGPKHDMAKWIKMLS